MGKKAQAKVLTEVPTNNPEVIYFSSFFTSIGHVYIAKSAKGVCYISFPHTTKNNFQLPFLKNKFIALEKNDLLLKYEIEILKEYFKSKKVTFDFALDLRHGSVFQKKVWKKLLEIPYGECQSYKWVAEQIGYPGAARAVGLANNKNPLPPVIPCHRVIGSNGKLVGYASGLHIKKQLLEMEYNTVNENCKLENE